MKRLGKKKTLSERVFALSDMYINGRNKRKQYIITYSVVFAVCFFLVFFWNFVLDRSFIWTIDGWAQHYKALVYFAEHGRKFLKALFVEHHFVIPQWDFSFGEGNDVLQTLHYYVIGDPFSLLSLLFTTRFMWLYYGFAILLRLYLAGLAFSRMCFYFDKNASRFAVIAGTVTYLFSFWALLNVNRHPFFLNPMLYFPLIVLGIEKIINKEKPYVFIIAVLFSATSNFYFFYMIVLITVIYTVVRLLVLYGRNFKEEVRIILRLGLFALVSVAMAAAIVLPICYTFIMDSRAQINTPIRFVYPFEYYASLPAMLFSEKFDYWLGMGYSSPAILTLVLFLKDKSGGSKGRKTLKILLLISAVIIVIPALGQVFNGFSYMNNRWCWALALVCSYICVIMWPKLIKLSKNDAVLLLAFLFISFILCIILEPSRTVSAFAGIAVCFALAIFLLLHEEILKNTAVNKSFMIQTVVCSMAVLSILIISLFQYHPRTETKYISETINRESVYSSLINNDAKEVLETAKKETSELYRYSGRGIEHNAGMIHGVSGTSYYWSNANPGVADFYNDLHITELETLIQKREGYDDRTALLSLESVRYYAVYKKLENNVIPYGFSLAEDKKTNNYIIYRNNNYLPLGYCYSETIGEEKWNSMSAVEKQEAMLQAAYIPEKNSNPVNVNLTSNNIEYDLSCGKGVKQKDGKFIVTKDNANIALSFEQISNCETYVYLNNLKYRGLSDYDIDYKLDKSRKNKLNRLGKYKVLNNRLYWTEPTKITFKIKDSLETQKRFYYYSEDYIHYGGNHDYLVNMGYKTEPIDYVIITFPKKGIYTLDSISVLAQPMDNYEAQISALKEDTLKEVKISDNTVTGKITLDKNKILCLSIPYSKGWKVWVDGEEAKLYQANIRNMALFLDSGEHDIVLRYKTPLLREGIFVSLLSITGFSLAVIIDYRKRKNQKRRETDV